MRIVDPHVHLWDLGRNRYPWLEQPQKIFAGNMAKIARNYVLEDLRDDAAPYVLDKIVHIDAGHDPEAPLVETRWLQALADDPANAGFPQAIVAAIDLTAENAEETLHAHRESRNLRGVRQILNVHADPAYDYVGRHYMREDLWQKRFKLLSTLDLSFDLQIYPSQMAEAAELAAAHPDTAIILNHCGMFADRGSVAGWREWRDGMRALAACANVSVKISGLGMLDHEFTVESIRPYALQTIDAFGTERCMFASNFPVDRLYSTYGELYDAFQVVVSDASVEEKAALFAVNAERIYRI